MLTYVRVKNAEESFKNERYYYVYPLTPIGRTLFYYAMKQKGFAPQYDFLGQCVYGGGLVTDRVFMEEG